MLLCAVLLLFQRKPSRFATLVRCFLFRSGVFRLFLLCREPILLLPPHLALFLRRLVRR